MSTTAYNPPQFIERLETLLAERFPDGQPPTVEQLGPFDQFHTGGYASTVELARLLGPGATDTVLDLGAGLGGSARYLASTYGCTVTGIDLSETFVDAAHMLTARTGLADRVDIRIGDACALTFADASFDAAIMLHVAMNIADRASLYSEVRRVLRPGGRFLTYDIVRVTGEPAYPAPWTADASQSFLRSADETRSLLHAAGFATDTWHVAEAHNAPPLMPPPGTPPPPIAALLAVDFPSRARNVAAAIADGRVAVLTALLTAV